MTHPVGPIACTVAIAAIHAAIAPSSGAWGQSPDGLSAVESGRGPAVVLVHGALGDQRQWAPIAHSLDNDNQVISISRRCHWPRPCTDGAPAYTYQLHADDLRAFLQSLKEPVHLVGHSYGAGVVLLTALRSPELVRTLTLIEPPFDSLVPPSAPGFAEELASRQAMTASVRARAEAGDDRTASEMLMDWVQGGPGLFRSLPSAAREIILANASTVGPTFKAPPPAITCTDVGTLRRPVLVIRGEGTRTWYRLIARAAADCIPGAAVVAVEGAAHMVIVDNPAGTARALAAFINRNTLPR